MKFKVVIPAAGLGSRLGKKTQHLSKALVTVAGKPAISYIIEKFNPDIPIVVALGYRGQLLKEILQTLYPSRVFEFVEVNPFDGPGSGLGLSLSACKSYLQCPFVFVSCDTIVEESIPSPTFNWMGHSEPRDTSQFRSIRVADGRVSEVCEKNAAGQVYPYIGLAGVHDYETFWKSMEEEDSGRMISTGEVTGLRGLVSSGIRSIPFHWYDTGSIEGLEETSKVFSHEELPTILEKPDEAIWFLGGEVAKFSADPKFIRNRVERARVLKGYCPQVIRSSEHVYVYPKAEGRVLSEVADIPLFRKFLSICPDFWKLDHPLSEEEKEKFEKSCLEFYREKTLKRVSQFFEQNQRLDRSHVINGIPVPPLKDILVTVDWKTLASGWAGNFHGDFHFENILYSEREGRFWFLDWRQEFGGSLTLGDVYYDLAKLKHGFIINHDIIRRDLYSVKENGEVISFDFLRKQILVECDAEFDRFILKSGFDLNRVRQHTALIFLNIAALHHHPYNLLLIYLGKSMLWQALQEQEFKQKR